MSRINTTAFDTSELIHPRDNSGFRRIGLRQYDDLTVKVMNQFSAIGMEQEYRQTVLTVGSEILQSPIERAVFAFLTLNDYGCGIRHQDVSTNFGCTTLPQNWREQSKVLVCPQFPVGPYHLDFGLFVDLNGFKIAIDVECDGIDYHSGMSAEKHDRQRDRFMEAQGFFVWRMAGSDINSQPLWAVEKRTVLELEAIESYIRKWAL